MEFQDYYAVMGVERNASQDDIKRSYRKLARKYHPDVSKEPDAEARFKTLGEAYAVLKDPEKRASYDELGANWKSGEDFHRPTDWAAGFEFSGDGRGDGVHAYSELFESLFGQRSGAPHSRSGFQTLGSDHHAKIQVELEDAYRGATRAISLRAPEIDDTGHVTTKDRTLNVRIPKGVRPGQRIRLAGQGSPGLGGGAAGDLYLEIEIQPHRLYTIDDRDVHLTLPLTPWEAVLGTTVKIPTPAGAVDLKIPPDTHNGRKLRLKGRGIPSRPAGDFFVTAELTLPPANTATDKDFYQKMQQDMNYDPRAHIEV